MKYADGPTIEVSTLEEFEGNMRATLDGIKQLAEAGP